MSSLDEFFDTRSEGWARLYAAHSQFRRRYELISTFLRDAVGATKPGIALDVGCGNGVFTIYLANRGWKVQAVDASSGMLEAARRLSLERIGEKATSIDFVHARVEERLIPPESLDLVLCLSTLEYILEDRIVLERLAKGLRREGRLIISVPNQRGVVRMVERVVAAAANLFPDRFPGTAYLAHQKHQYLPPDLDSFLSQFGLVRKRGAFFSVGLPLPKPVLPVFERPWWAGMYVALYTKRPSL
jgi:2-polyprenyl-3-methyl-5-hydroxy-6-metoxy-1,4-benzoquinol methylase